ncbi:major capsid protein, partial [Acinetobacter baumannii]
ENPDLTLLGSSANWKKHATSNKMTAGTLLDLSGTTTG